MINIYCALNFLKEKKIVGQKRSVSSINVYILITCSENTYFWSSFPSAVAFSIMVLNKTIPLHGSHGQHTGLHRVALKEHVSNQRIIFRVNGNASAYNIKCFRYDQSGSQNVRVLITIQHFRKIFQPKNAYFPPSLLWHIYNCMSPKILHFHSKCFSYSMFIYYYRSCISVVVI